MVATFVLVALTFCLCVCYCVSHKHKERNERVQKNPKSKADGSLSVRSIDDVSDDSADDSVDKNNKEQGSSIDGNSSRRRKTAINNLEAHTAQFR